MTCLMDKFFIALGFDAKELEAASFRVWLYVGMTFMASLAMTFFTLTIFN